jgi:hypothetical protein
VRKGAPSPPVASCHSQSSFSAASSVIDAVVSGSDQLRAVLSAAPQISATAGPADVPATLVSAFSNVNAARSLVIGQFLPGRGQR